MLHGFIKLSTAAFFILFFTTAKTGGITPNFRLISLNRPLRRTATGIGAARIITSRIIRNASAECVVDICIVFSMHTQYHFKLHSTFMINAIEKRYLKHNI